TSHRFPFRRTGCEGQDCSRQPYRVVNARSTHTITGRPPPRRLLQACPLRPTPEPAELEVLRASPGRRVVVPPTPDQRKLLPQQAAEAGPGGALDRQSAAPLRPVGRESADNEMSARYERPPQAVEVGALLIRFGEEVEGGAVVPHVILRGRFPLRRISRDPGYAPGGRANPCARRVERRLR